MAGEAQEEAGTVNMGSQGIVTDTSRLRPQGRLR
jgi:hypothetical protein